MTSIALNLVDSINHALAANEMTVKAAETFFSTIEQLTGRRVALLAKRVVFYTPGLPTKYHETHDAHAVLWHLEQYGK